MKKKNVWPSGGAKRKVRRSPESLEFLSWLGTMESSAKSQSNPSVIVETFHIAVSVAHTTNPLIISQTIQIIK